MKMKIPCWIEVHRRQKWRMTSRIASLPEERWTSKIFDWHPGLDNQIKTRRLVGRPKRRWEDTAPRSIFLFGVCPHCPSVLTWTNLRACGCLLAPLNESLLLHGHSALSTTLNTLEWILSSTSRVQSRIWMSLLLLPSLAIRPWFLLPAQNQDIWPKERRRPNSTGTHTSIWSRSFLRPQAGLAHMPGNSLATSCEMPITRH